MEARTDDTSASPSSSPSAPAPDGGMAAQVAATDWSATPVGPAEHWPQSLRTALDICLSSRFPMLVWWGPQLIDFYNDAYLPTLGDKHPAALGRPASEVWPEAWHELGPLADQVLSGGGATFNRDQLLLLQRHGYVEETYWTFSYSPIAEESGGVGGIFVVATDTTDQVLGERRLRVLRDLGELSASAMTTVQDACRTAVEVLDRHRSTVPTAVALLRGDDGDPGLSPVAVSGAEPGTPVAAGRLPAAVHAVVRRVLDTGVAEVCEGLSAADGLRPSPVGTAVADRAVVLPVVAAGEDDAAGVLVLGVDPYRALDAGYRGFFDLVAGHVSTAVTDARAYQAERRRAEALAELDRAKTDFFSNVSHEFRTPLTLIMGPVAELRSSPAAAADARVAHELAVVERNALRLQKLVNTLLDFSRLQAGRIDARFEPVDLAAVTAELASVFRSAVERAGLTLTVDTPPLPTPVHVDRDMWEKVVLNLLSNALKYTFTGEITVALREDGDRAVLTVADTGTGIPAAELPRLFERFTRVSGARSRSGEGSGIGLAMVRELVGLHGGEIAVDSTPDVGTSFTVALPLGAAHLPADQLAPPAPEAPAVSGAVTPFVSEALRWLPEDAGEVVPAVPGPRTGRVLVADDNADMRNYVVRLLAPVHEVRAVSDGRAALEAALADPPDLVVSDVMMPELDGLELLGELRADPRTARVPVVLLSARAGQDAAVEGLAAGADDYLVKPFSAQELLARVDAHLQLGRARREAEERFTAMADLAPALIWVADAEGRRVFLNAAWTDYTGRPPADERGDGWRGGLHPQDRERYLAAVAEGAVQGGGWEVEFRLRRSDGAFHWLLERAVPIGSAGGAGGWVGSCTDINARYQETERQSLLAEVGAVLDRQTEVEGQLAELARLVVDRRLADVASVRVLGEDGRLRYAGRAAIDAGVRAGLDDLEPHDGIGLEVLGTGLPVLRTRGSEGPDGIRLDMHSALVVPLSVRGQVRAVMALGRRGDAAAFHEDDRALAEEVAARAALALDNALLLADERATARRLGLLQRVTAELSAATTPVDVADAAAGHVVTLTGHGGRVAVYELDDAGRELRILFLTGDDAEARERFARIPLSAPLAVTTAVTERRPLWIEDMAHWPGARGGLSAPQSATLSSFGLRSTVSLPLLVAGRVVGVIGIGFPETRRFGSAERSMLLAVAEQCAQALDRARLYRAQQSIASTLQLSLLPQRLPQLEQLALAAEYLPGAEGTSAGGDWYDVVELGEGRVAIAVGDVVGQGPTAAAVMGQLRSALSAALLQGCPPADALELLDRFAARLPGALASTAACLVLDQRAGTVRWSRAGHPPPLLITDAGATPLEDGGGGAVLGAPGRPPFTEGTAAVAPGATLLLYTDGLVERRGEPLDDGLERVARVAAGLADADPARLTRALLAEVLDDSAPPDDVAVIAARVIPPPVHETLPADPARLRGVRRTVTAWARAAGLDEDSVDDLQLALGEALANAVEHAYATRGGEGRCEYRLGRTADGSIEVCVRDEGVWRPAPADRGYRGRGLELISALAAEVEVARTPDDAGADGSGTTVRFRFVPQGGGPGDAPLPARSRGTGGEPARLTVHRGPDRVLLRVAGEVDLATAPGLRAEALRVLEDLTAGRRVVLDLEQVGYLASAGVGLVLELQAVAAARHAVLDVRTRPGSAPARVLALGGVAVPPG